MKRFIYIVCVNIVVFTILFSILEMGSRFFFPVKNIQPIFEDQKLRVRQRPFVRPHETRGFELVPDFSNGLYSINANGFRGDGLPVPLGHEIILVLGESTTFGWGVRNDETYPAHLEAFFKDAPVSVINGGVPSYTSSQVLVTLQEILDSEEFLPDLILINILWNDIWYSTVSNWHPDILIYQRPPAWLSFLTTHSRFCHLLVMGGPKNKNLTNIFNAKALNQYKKNIEQMIELCLKRNIRVAFVVPPFDSDHMPEEGLNEFHVRYDKEFFIKTAKIYIESLHSIIKKYQLFLIPNRLDIRFLHQHDLFLDPLHPTGQGNAIIANDIFRFIMDKDLVNIKK